VLPPAVVVIDWLRLIVSAVRSAPAGPASVSGALTSVFGLQKNLVFSVVDDLGIELTTEEREAINQVHTESLLAFMAYSRGLDFEDKGLYDQAEAEYRSAVAIDPNFGLANAGLDQIEVAKTAANEVKTSISDFEKTASEPADADLSNAKADRLHLTGLSAQTGQLPQGNDARELAESTGDDALQSSAKIVIRVPLPDNK